MRAVAVLLLCLLPCARPGSLSGQIISPGELTAAHRDLSGITDCTQCHQLRQRGVANDRCLACHAPLRARIGLGRGLHAKSADENCGACHKDHLGSGADIVRFDTTSFLHDQMAFDLVEAHAAVGCASCHNPTLIGDREVLRLKSRGGTLDRTYLGLSRACAACHEREGPHGDQFGTDSCANCHTQTIWSPASTFDHATSRYPLTGLHAGTPCAACHGSSESPDIYRGLPFQGCADCHSDPHGGGRGATCASCHSTGGWKRVPRSKFVSSFDHSVTGFALRGAHGDATCASCHEPAPQGAGLHIELTAKAVTAGFAPPGIERGCASCHVDYHGGELDEAGGGSDCGACHGETGWAPSSFDVFSHADARFPLTEAHRAVRCASCHVGVSGEQPGAYSGFKARTGHDLPPLRMRFELSQRDCESCHAVDDPHDRQFEDRACASCHTPARGYAITEFDHGTTTFALDGAHRSVLCAACHVPLEGSSGMRVQYRPLSSRCQDCHVGGGR